MVRWLVRRLVLAIPVVWGVVTISFILMRLAPGDPARNALGDKASEAAVAALRHQWGLDRSLPQQYFSYLGGAIRGDLGQSLYFRTPISALLAQRLPVTLALIVLAAVLAAVIAVPLASLSATRPDGVVALSCGEGGDLPGGRLPR
jgi:peptide/nickel transport system permease protein